MEQAVSDPVEALARELYEAIDAALNPQGPRWSMDRLSPGVREAYRAQARYVLERYVARAELAPESDPCPRCGLSLSRLHGVSIAGPPHLSPDGICRAPAQLDPLPERVRELERRVADWERAFDGHEARRRLSMERIDEQLAHQATAIAELIRKVAPTASAEPPG